MTQIYDSPTESSTTEQAKERAQAAAGQAKDKAGSQLRSQVDQRSTDAGHRVGGLAPTSAPWASPCASRARTSRPGWPSRRPIAPSGSGATSRRATPIASWATSRTSASAAVGRDRRWRGHRARRLALPQGLVDRPLREAHERPAARAGRPRRTDHAARVRREPLSHGRCRERHYRRPARASGR